MHEIACNGGFDARTWELGRMKRRRVVKGCTGWHRARRTAERKARAAEDAAEGSGARSRKLKYMRFVSDPVTHGAHTFHCSSTKNHGSH